MKLFTYLTNMHMYLYKKLIFFETFKYILNFFWQNGLNGARPLQRRTLCTTYFLLPLF